jgi:pyruvate formate lyase activating enzyme
LEEVLRYGSFIKGGGVTFSGGEPLCQPEFVYAAATLLKEAGIGAALDTSGGIYPGDPAVRMAIGASELLLMDIKAWDNETAVKLTGRGVENALATLDYCETTGKPVWIRYVLLTGYTDDDRQLNATADYLTRYKCVKRVELLPFHKLGEAKWEQSGRKYLLGKTPATTKGQIENAKAIIASYGLPVQ